MKIRSILPTHYRRLSLSASLVISAAWLPTAVFPQATGTVSCTDPLTPGYIYRASRMLTTGNPLGTSDQIAASADDLDALSPDLKAEWLALEGAALFERGDGACIGVLSSLVEQYPASPRATQAILTIGDWYWLHADWHNAIKQYSSIDISNLPTEQNRLYSYRLALAYLKCGVPEKALPILDPLTRTPDYGNVAKYYIAYIYYLDGDYDKAYSMMEEVASAGSAEDGIEPRYYMTQIEYLRGQYDDVITHAAAILARDRVPELSPELHRISGLSYFKKGDIDNARKHLEKFMSSTSSPDDDAVYVLGAILYSDGDLNRADSYFRTLTDLDNILAQGAYLYLGQIAEQKGDMNAAAMAFNKAASMAYDPKVAETALYNHITALSKGGNAPFASSISMLEDFLRRYPSSPYAPEVQESLAAAFFHENNYDKALDAINKVANPSAPTLATKQKILYRLGAGELSSGRLRESATHLREASAMKSSDPALAAESSLWLGEALYRSGDFKGAAAAYRDALRGSLSKANRVPARYGLAYSAFRSSDWKEARTDFAAVAEDTSAPADMRADALVRDADCLLYLGDYSKAADKYQRAARQDSGDPDYAAFRHAVVAGLTDGTDTKMKELNAFLKERKGSKWTSEVLLEAGKTMAALDRPDKAAPYFERLTSEYPKDNRSRSGALSLALAYMKQGEIAKAEEAYKEIIRNWPTSEEAALANDDMRRICAADNRLMEYAQFLSGIKGAPQIDADEMDAISFEAAETAFADNQDNTAPLEKYLVQFPDGRYIANALMDLAEAADNAGDTDKALSYLSRLLSSRGDAPQVPAALFLQADLLEGAGRPDEALRSYLLLEQRGGAEFAPEATAGVMRTTSDADQRTRYARRLLSMGGVEAEDAEDARFYEASGLLRGSDPRAGEEALKKLTDSPNSLSGAKAAVELGDWYLSQGDPKRALSTLEAFTDAGSIHAYWLARGFISLADAYHADGNDYLAAEYLKSLRDNYPGEEQDIREAIQTKLSEYSK